MNILLVDNGTIHTADILGLLSEHNVTIHNYSGKTIPMDDMDIILLSGSSDTEGEYTDVSYDEWFAEERELIRTSKVPILGICLGFELICETFGSKRVKLPFRSEGPKRVIMNNDGLLFFGRDSAVVHEGHWNVIEAVDDTQLRILASSSTGIEAIKHMSRSLVGVQFHPEVTTEPGLRISLLEDIIAKLVSNE